MRLFLPTLLAVVLGDFASAQETPAKKLSEYKLKTRIDPILGIRQNASGMTYSPVTKTLFIVLDSPSRVIEWVPGGKLVRTVELKDFDDPEGITHVDGDRFAIVEEGRGTISVISIPPGTTRVKKSDRTQKISVIKEGGNLGLEGITYDPKQKVFYVVKEKDPLRVYEVTGDEKVSRMKSFADSPQFEKLKDLSGIYFDPRTELLILLSHESRIAMAFTREGKFVSQLAIDLRKAEGITIDDTGTLYICGEPSEMCIYK